MGLQYNPSQFDPSKLGRIISSEPVYDPDQGYMGRDDGGLNTGGRNIIGYKVVRESPWGPILVNAQDAAGTPKPAAQGEPQYTTARPNANGTIGDFNNQVAFVNTGNGFAEVDGAQYLTEMSRGGAYKPFFKFLAAAGLGAGAAYASGVTGANATFAGAAGEGGAAGFGVGGNAATGTAAASAANGGFPQGTNLRGMEGGSDAVYNGTGAVDPGMASQAAQLAQQLGINPADALKLLGGVAGAGFNLWNTNQQQDKLNEAAKGYADKVTAAGQQAADMSKFTPFNVSGGLASAKFDGNNVTQSLDPRLKAIQDQSLSSAGGFLGGVNSGTPQQQSQAAYQNYLSWAKPAQEQQFSGLQDRLARQGLLGVSVNTQAVPPVQSADGQTLGIQGGTNADFQAGGRFGGGNNTVSVNPYYKDFAQGVALADLKNYENSIRFGQETTNNQINMGKGMLGIGVGLDQLGTDAINQGAKLGEAQSRAGAVAGGFLANSARDAANVGMNRAGSEASADAERNRQIWESIFKNLF